MLSSVGVVFPNGHVSCEGSGDPGKLVGGVVGHVKEMVFGCFVFYCWLEQFLITSHVEPVAPMVGGEASKRLPLLIGLGHVLIKEVLPQNATGGFVGGGCVGGQAVNCFIEGNAGVGWAVRKVKPDARVALKKVQ